MGFSFLQFTWYIPFNESNTAEYAALIRPLFADEKIAKIGQNIKFDLMVLGRLGVDWCVWNHGRQ